MADDTRDKVIALEADVKYLTAQIDGLSKQVAEIHDLLQQARGARWLLLGLATFGGFIASKAIAFLPQIK